MVRKKLKEGPARVTFCPTLACTTPTCGSEFFMDFGFMRASADDYKKPNKSTDRIVYSYDGFCAYLAIVDGASRRVWCFLTKSKEPPIQILRAFMKKFGNGDGCVRLDQGGELARSSELKRMMLDEFGYTVEPTGADSPSQNGGVEIFNGTLAVKVRTLLYGSGLPATFWSSALLHAVYLQNRLVHSATNMTPYEGWYDRQPNLTHLKCFGSRVCVKETGTRRCKLDKHDFTGIFLGYTATDMNILYLDTTLGVVKDSHHAVFDEAWYLQDSRPPAAQLLYDLGLEADDFPTSHPDCTTPPPTPLDVPWPQPIFPPSRIEVAWPPMPTTQSPCKGIKWIPPSGSLRAHLPLRVTQQPPPLAARAARLRPSPLGPQKSKKQIASEVVNQYLIGPRDMELIYMSPDPYGKSFEAFLDLRKSDLTTHRTGRLRFLNKDDRLILASMDSGTPGARINKWRTHLRGAWLISINNSPVHSLLDMHQALLDAAKHTPSDCILLFSHPEVTPNISKRGVPIMSSNDFTQYTHDQLNNRLDLLRDVECRPDRTLHPSHSLLQHCRFGRRPNNTSHGLCVSPAVAFFNKTTGATGREASPYNLTNMTIKSALGSLSLSRKMTRCFI